ncbi:tetratricopeptide repeat protein [Halomonas sp. 18H]|nr:tetratricopeptide repeat protein [Halomonas sp. 18H]MCW4151582.1 tetratricopeptide repeat protein [Halomonas sp. 18H]
MSRRRITIRAGSGGIALFALAMMLVGCHSLPSPPPLEDPVAEAPPVARGLDAQGLSSLLVAELAGQRGDYQRAGRGYMASARRYTSASLAERAALASRFSNDRELVEEAARLWQRLAPNDTSPGRLLAELAVQRNDWEQALAYQLDLLGQSEGSETEQGARSLVPFVETALEAGASPAPLLDRLREFSAPPQARQELDLARALLEAAGGLDETAEQRLARLADESPRLPGLWRIRAAVALEAGRAQQAERMARRGLGYLPGDPRLILLQVQADIRQGNIAAAETNTDALLKKHGDTPDLRQALARLYLEEEHQDPARRLLLPLTSRDSTPPEVYLLLGTIAEQQSEVDNALLYYRQVPEGQNFLTARANAARMLFDNSRPQDARTFLQVERLRHPSYAADLLSLEVALLEQHATPEQAGALLDRAIERHPDNSQLRYQRAMRAARQGQLAVMERDLRRLLEQQPDNANALNALGYTLADLDVTERLDEARQLIERALALSPENPAILDSMGWVRYRQGELEAALPWLERAWQGMKDQEVAAHLIEVLWQLGQRERAREILEQSLQRFETQPKVDELLERFPELDPDA